MTKEETNLRRYIKRMVDKLSKDSLASAAGFLSYLHSLESDATAEILHIPGAVDKIENGDREVAAGDVVPLRKLRRKYQWTRAL